MMETVHFTVRQAKAEDLKFAADIANEISISAAKRGTGIKRRPASYIEEKISSGLAVIAISKETGAWMGFSCVEVWSHQRFLANTGLIVPPQFRGLSLSKYLKEELFYLCRNSFPQAKIFSMTTSKQVIESNYELGFKTMSYRDILRDPLFANGCTSWVDYPELMRTHALQDDGSGYVVMIYEPVTVSLWTSFSKQGLEALRTLISVLAEPKEKPAFLFSNSGQTKTRSKLKQIF